MTYTPSKAMTEFTGEFYEDFQRVFNYIVDRIVEQGEPSIRPFADDRIPTCMYTRIKENGVILHCAAGHILTPAMREVATRSDEKGSIDFETLVDRLRDCMATPLAMEQDHFILFISSMQEAHDNIAQKPEFVRRFLTRCVDVANQYSLDTSAVQYHRAQLGLIDPL